MSVDFNKVAMLLHIVESGNPNKYGDRLKPIHDMAMAELQVIADAAWDELEVKRVEAAKKEAEAQVKAKAVAKAKVEADRQQEARDAAGQARAVHAAGLATYPDRSVGSPGLPLTKEEAEAKAEAEAQARRAGTGAPIGPGPTIYERPNAPYQTQNPSNENHQRPIPTEDRRV